MFTVLIAKNVQLHKSFKIFYQNCIMKIFADYYNPVDKAIQFVQAEKLFYETALIQAGKNDADGELIM